MKRPATGLLIVCCYALLFGGVWVAHVSASAPANDMFADRIAVTGLPLRLVGDTSEATVEPEEPTDGGRFQESVWWSWMAPKSGVIGIYFGLNRQRGLRVFIGNRWEELQAVPLTLSPDLNAGFRTIPTLTDWSFRAEAGMTYQIAVYDAGLFTLDLMERPDNDFFADRLEIPAAGGVIHGTTTNATYEPEERGVTNKSVWYSWTPDFSGQAMVMLSGGNGTDGVQVFTGESLTSLVGVAASDSGDRALLPFVVSAGQSHSLRVSGRRGPELFRLSVGRAPTNDDFAAATLITGYSALVEGTTFGMTVQPGEPYMSHATASTGTAWWKWIAPTNGLLRIKAGDLRYWAPYRLFAGTELSHLRRLGSPFGNTGSGYPDHYPVARGRTYYLRFEDTPFIKAEFDLFPRPANDSFDRRITLEGLSVSTAGDNHLATRQKGEPAHGGHRSGNSVWWTWTAPMSGYVFVNSVGSDFQNILAAYTGESLRHLKLVADNRAAFWTGILGFPVESGVSYHLAESGIVDYDSETGRRRITRGVIRMGLDFTTLMFSSPTNGSLLVGPTNVTLSLNTPLEAVDGNITWAEFYRPRYWWDPSIIIPVGAVASAPYSLTVPNLVPGIHIYGAKVTNHLGQPRVVAPVVFSIRPPNDNFSESIRLDPIPGVTRGWIGGAGWEPRENRPLRTAPHAGSVWWTWTAPETDQFHMQVSTTTSFVLYKGSALGALKTVAKFRLGETRFEVEGGETYHLQAYALTRFPWDTTTEIEFNLSR